MENGSGGAVELNSSRFLGLSGTLLAVIGFDLRIRWLSDSFPRTLGFGAEALLDSPFTDFVHPEDLGETIEHVQRLIRGEDVAGFEFRTLAADDSYRRLLTSAVGVPDEGLIYAIAQDVSEFREAESLFESAFANARLAMFVASVDPAELGRLTAANPAASRFTGYSIEELLARDFQSLVHPEDLESVLEALGVLMRGESESFQLEKRYLHADGHPVWGRMHVALIHDAADRPIYGVAQVQDITDRKRVEAEVAAAERRFEQIFADAPIGMALQDTEGRYLQVNRALCGLFGYSPAELLEMRFQQLVHPEDLPKDEELRDSMLSGETKVTRREKRFRRRDGSWLEAEVAISCVSGPEGCERFIVQLQDITHRKQVERVVHRSRERLQAMIDGMPSGVWVKDLEGRFETVNRYLAAGERQRPEEIVGRLDSEVYPAELIPRFRAVEAKALAAKEPVTTEETVEMGHAVRTFAVQAFALRDPSGEPYATAGTATDITDRVRAEAERRELEARAQEAHRIETVGRLAGGIAHDFNNLLSVILNNATLAAEALPEGSEVRDDLEEIHVAAERAADLTHQLLQFSRQEMIEPQVLDPNEVVVRAERLLRRTIGEDVELRTALGDGVPAIEIDPGQLERVLLNLAINARDAMPGGGTLEIVTASVETGEGRRMRLAVCDTGAGMAPEVAAQAFEPFYTTKPGGKGVGLGLATVYGIVQQAGGTIEIDSRVGGGTHVVMEFPAAAAAPVAAGDSPAARRALGRGETVLVAEDESSVRRLAARLLREGGYEVIEASGGSQALAEIEARDGSVDLLLTDVVMPETSGRELAESVRAIRPEVSVLFMSGYTDDVVLRHGVAMDDLSFVAKPFTRDSLLGAVSQTLARRRV